MRYEVVSLDGEVVAEVTSEDLADVLIKSTPGFTKRQKAIWRSSGLLMAKGTDLYLDGDNLDAIVLDHLGIKNIRGQSEEIGEVDIMIFPKERSDG